jgi:Transposase DDE domain
VGAPKLAVQTRARLPHLPDVVREWRDTHPDHAIPDGLVLSQPWPATASEKARGIPDRVIHCQYRHDRARKTLRGIDEQVAKAQRAVDGHAPVKRNRYIQLTAATKSVKRALETKTRALAGWKGYTTNLVSQPPQFVIEAYHQLWRIEKSFRMSKHDLAARPIYHHTRDSIEAHLTIVFAALAVSHWIEHQTGWSIKKFVRTTRHSEVRRCQPLALGSIGMFRCSCGLVADWGHRPGRHERRHRRRHCVDAGRRITSRYDLGGCGPGEDRPETGFRQCPGSLRPVR